MQPPPSPTTQETATPRETTPNNRTFEAMLGHGIDSGTAGSLIRAGHTVGKLQLLTDVQLSALGVSAEATASLLDGPRPPVPSATVYRLLFESRSACCVCRDRQAPIVIHHIVEWCESRSHDTENLVILCLNHHGEAHTRHELSQNLTVDRLRALKSEWTATVARLDREAVLRQPSMGQGVWDYFNHVRVMRALEDSGIPLWIIPHYAEARELGILASDGSVAVPPVSQARRYLYAGHLTGGNALYNFTKAALDELIRRRPPVPGTQDFSRTLFRHVVTDGCLLAVKGRFWFSRGAGAPAQGPGQTRTGIHRRNGVELRFTFDAWEALSDSAWGGHLAGQSSATAIGLVRSRTRDAARELLVVNMTCLALGSCWGDPTFSDCIYQYEEVVEPPDDWWDSDGQGSPPRR